MTSWRDTASTQVLDDFAGMLLPVTEFAEHALSKFGELSPFGAAVTADGQIIMVAADPDSTDGLPDDQVVDTLYEGALSHADHWRAAAFVAEVTLVEGGGDALLFALEHCEGAAVDVVLPYSQDPSHEAIAFGDTIEVISDRLIWSPERQAQWRASRAEAAAQ